MADQREADPSCEHDPHGLAARAYDAFDRGDLIAARSHFDALLLATAGDADHEYMQGLTCKYLRDWPKSLAHNLRSLALRGGPDEAAQWNAAIAATALGDWAEARRQWASCGIEIPDGEGPIETHFGVASLRLDAWGRGETLFARRIDPVRAQLINVPLPDSGYRFGDIVLHDGAATGQRRFHQSIVPVLNALQRLQKSEFQTFAAFVSCPDRRDLESLLQARVPGIAEIEDWTESVGHLCLRCSYGTPHRHGHPEADSKANTEDPVTDVADAWRSDRDLGIAAQSKHSVTRLLRSWATQGSGRRIAGIESRDHEPSAPPHDGVRWWLSPEEREQD